MAESFASDYEDAYDEMLDEMGAAVLSQYSVSRMLRETDPIAYEVGMRDYESSILADYQNEGDDSPYEDMFDDDEELTSEGEKMLKEMYDEMLDESGVEALLNNYDASRLLKETDPIAYRVGLSDYESSMEEDDRNVYRDMAMQRKGMMAETFGASANKCFICSKPATRERGFTNRHLTDDGEGTKPRITGEDGSIWFCKEHDNLYDFGLFSAGNILAWTHPNGTKYVQGRLLKDAETFGADGGFFSKYPATYYKIAEEEGIFYLPATDSSWLIHGEDALTQEQAMEKIVGRDFKSESSGLIRLPTDEPNFDPQKADRNKDGKISSWERTVGNKVAKGIREGRKTSSKGIDTFAEPFEDIGISKPYARLGVIAAGITALAFGVKKLRK